MGGQRGDSRYPEISTLASAIHEMFAAHPFRIPDVRESLSSLILKFSELRDWAAVPVPEHIAEALSGRRIALIGFTSDHADGVCAALELVGRPSEFISNHGRS